MRKKKPVNLEKVPFKHKCIFFSEIVKTEKLIAIRLVIQKMFKGYGSHIRNVIPTQTNSKQEMMSSENQNKHK